ncbi:hypothetical protein [Fodinicurvata halophila]|uniref:hypothetical protein n=1 Tax=Fodinicurvata halophila TaxID=1419723 RepID=UPI00362D8A68
MSIWGKIVGGAAGFALGGPIGALLGGLAGHAVDVMNQSTQLEPPSTRRTPRTAWTGIVPRISRSPSA